MKSLKRTIATILSLSVCMSVLSVSVYAETRNEIRVSTATDPYQGEVISTYEPVTRSSANVTFDHYYGTNFKEDGSSSYKEQVWGKTYHYIKKSNAQNEAVDGYTRARWESTINDNIYLDSGRCWDNADGYIDGMSEAKSGWLSEPMFVVAHTYYGN